MARASEQASTPFLCVTERRKKRGYKPTMAFRTAATTTSTSMLKGAMGSLGCRWCSHVALPVPLERVMDLKPENPFTLPGEFDREMEKNTQIEVPRFSFGGSMELMAVPKKKVSKHKRGIRNGPRALKPIPVIMRCKCCGRVKLPHFFCCSGDRGMTGERSDTTS